jgi:hypothetical protein
VQRPSRYQRGGVGVEGRQRTVEEEMLTTGIGEQLAELGSTVATNSRAASRAPSCAKNWSFSLP